MLGATGQCIPTALDKLLVSLVPTLGGVHLAVDPACAFAVAADIQGREYTLGELAGFGQDGISQVTADVLAAGQLTDLIEQAELVEDELHVAQGGGVFTHDEFPVGSFESGRLGKYQVEQTSAELRPPRVGRVALNCASQAFGSESR
ncbi:hypothetical protein D9M71_439370 [compost metagenome]